MIEINDDSRRTFITNSEIKSTTSMLLSYLWDFRYAYIHVKETITVSNTVVAGAIINNVDKKVICKICAPFTDFISEINNT